MLVEHGHHPVGGGPLRERREHAQVGEEHRHLGHLPAQGGLGQVGQRGGGNVGRHVLAEQPVELAVGPGVLQPDGQLAGQGPQQPRSRSAGPRPGARPAPQPRSRPSAAGPTAPVPLGLLGQLQRLQRGPARVAAVAGRHLPSSASAACSGQPAASTPGTPADRPRPARPAARRAPAPGRSARPPPPAAGARRRSPAPRLRRTRARRRSICSRSATIAWAACSSTWAWPSVRSKRSARSATTPADRPGAVALGLLHGLDQRLQGGGVLAAELPDGLLEVDAVEQVLDQEPSRVLHVGAVVDEGEPNAIECHSPPGRASCGPGRPRSAPRRAGRRR